MGASLGFGSFLPILGPGTGRIFWKTTDPGGGELVRLVVTVRELDAESPPVSVTVFLNGAPTGLTLLFLASGTQTVTLDVPYVSGDSVELRATPAAPISSAFAIDAGLRYCPSEDP